MNSPVSPLRAALIANDLSVEVIATHLTAVETWLSGLAEQPQFQSLCDQLESTIDQGGDEIVLRFRDDPNRTALLFALMPAVAMFRLFGQLDKIDDNLLTGAVKDAAGVIGDLARQRFGFVHAMYTLCQVLANRHRGPVPQ